MDVTHYHDCNTLVTATMCRTRKKIENKYFFLSVERIFGVVSRSIGYKKPIIRGSSECGLNTSDSISPLPVSVFPTKIFCSCVSQSPSWCWNKKIFLSLQYFDYIYPRPEHGPDTAISEMARVNYLFSSNARHLFKKWSLFLVWPKWTKTKPQNKKQAGSKWPLIAEEPTKPERDILHLLEIADND